MAAIRELLLQMCVYMMVLVMSLRRPLTSFNSTTLFAISKGIQAVELCSNKILRFITVDNVPSKLHGSIAAQLS